MLARPPAVGRALVRCLPWRHCCKHIGEGFGGPSGGAGRGEGGGSGPVAGEQPGVSPLSVSRESTGIEGRRKGS